MDNGCVKTDIAEGIATVTFHHPKSNSLPGTILRAMAKAIEDAGKDPAVRVVVLRSEGGKAFCAGASFDELLAIDNADKGREFFSGFAGGDRRYGQTTHQMRTLSRRALRKRSLSSSLERRAPRLGSSR